MLIACAHIFAAATPYLAEATPQKRGCNVKFSLSARLIGHLFETLKSQFLGNFGFQKSFARSLNPIYLQRFPLCRGHPFAPVGA
jgi:hypothetical protein